MKLEDKKSEMLEYINSKYSDRFEFKDYFGGYAGSEEKKIIVSSEKYGNAEICVSRKETDEGVIFRDNYLAVIYEERTAEYLEALLQAEFGVSPVLVYQSSMLAFTENSTDEMTFEEFLKEPSSAIMFTAVIPVEEVSDELAEKLTDFLESSFVSCSGTVYFDTASETLPQAEKISQYLYQHKYSGALFFEFDAVNDIGTIRWEDGHAECEQ